MPSTMAQTEMGITPIANAQPTYQKCDKGDKGDGGQIVAHGGVAHDDAFFLGNHWVTRSPPEM